MKDLLLQYVFRFLTCFVFILIGFRAYQIYYLHGMMPIDGFTMFTFALVAAQYSIIRIFIQTITVQKVIIDKMKKDGKRQ